MNDLIILGTDTDAGKTAFALLCLTAFPDRFEYWKPVESGEPDSRKVASVTRGVGVHAPLRSFARGVAPPLAARWEGGEIPAAAKIAAARPAAKNNLLVETFGSPFSPLNERELQIELIKALDLPAVLVSAATLGTIGRTLQCLEALRTRGVTVGAVVLMGARDDYALEQIKIHGALPAFGLPFPDTWDGAGFSKTAGEHRDTLQRIVAAFLRPQASETSMNLVERDNRVVWHPYTSLRDANLPLPCVEARDEFLILADGRRVIDAISSWWTILHRHRHPVLMAALAQAARVIDHVHFAGVTHPWGVELAERMLGTLPWTGGRAFFSDNGSTAVEVALKMAYQFWCHRGQPGRTTFIGFEGGYHGDTFGAMAVSRDPVFFGRFEPLLFPAVIVPHSPEALDATLTRLQSRVAGIIVEPLVQGAGGMRMHTPEHLRQLAEVAQNHGIPIIVDEVMTGGGRTGTLWAHQAAGIVPDLVCAGKTLAGGIMPLAVTLAAPHIGAEWETSEPAKTFFHGHSFTGHPLACAVAVANWKMLTARPNPIPRKMEEFWIRALEPVRRSPRVREVRIRGTIAAIELDVPGGYLADIGRQIRRRSLEMGVLLRPLGNVVYAMPPMDTSTESLEKIARALVSAVEMGRAE